MDAAAAVPALGGVQRCKNIKLRFLAIESGLGLERESGTCTFLALPAWTWESHLWHRQPDGSLVAGILILQNLLRMPPALLTCVCTAGRWIETSTNWAQWAAQWAGACGFGAPTNGGGRGGPPSI